MLAVYRFITRGPSLSLGILMVVGGGFCCLADIKLYGEAVLSAVWSLSDDVSGAALLSAHTEGPGRALPLSTGSRSETCRGREARAPGTRCEALWRVLYRAQAAENQPLISITTGGER